MRRRVFYKPRTEVIGIPPEGKIIEVEDHDIKSLFYYPAGNFNISRIYCTEINEENEFGEVSP